MALNPGRLVLAIEEKGITQRDLARLLGVQEATVSGWVHGKAMSRHNVLRVADALGVSVDWLLGRSNDGGPVSLNDRSASPDPRNGVVRVGDDPGADAPTDRVDRLIGLLEKLEGDVAKALSIADRNSEAVRQMSADTHRLLERVLPGAAAIPPTGPTGETQREGASNGR